MIYSREEFLHRQNVATYTKLLATSQDLAQRATLMRLLAEEGVAAKVCRWAPLYP